MERPAASVELVTRVRWDNDMPGCKDEDPLAFPAFADVDTAGALQPRRGFGSDPQTECGSEWTASFKRWVVGGDVTGTQPASNANGPTG